MDQHSETQPTEAVPMDPTPESPPPGGATELQVPLWQSGPGAGPESFPTRPGDPDCIYYLRTGSCAYGDRCRFNHPYDRSMVMEVAKAGGGEHPQRPGHPVCKHYVRTRMCRFGGTCKYHHPKHESESSAPVTLNIYGYPLREGVEECTFYAKTGQCRFGRTCIYHHPQPAGVQPPVPAHTAVYPSGLSPAQHQQYTIFQENWPVSSPTMYTGTYLYGIYGTLLLPPGVFTVPGWSPYPAPVAHVASPSTQPTVSPRPQLSPSATAYTGSYVSMTSSAGPSSSSQNEDTFPERPGMPTCMHYMKTGYCKFSDACKYNHPTQRSPKKTNFFLSPAGLPLRPGTQLCPHYAQSGVCALGALCMFDHPMKTLRNSVSAPSLTEMPDVPGPVGSVNLTLPPLFSSADWRPDPLPVFGNVHISSQMSSVNSGPIPPSSIQQNTSGKGKGKGSIKSCEGEVQTSR